MTTRTSPIEMVLSGATWEPCPEPVIIDGLPYATHSGVLEIMGSKLRCYRLNTGAAMFEAEDLARLFGFETAEEFERETNRLFARQGKPPIEAEEFAR